MADITINQEEALWLLSELFKSNPAVQMQATNILLARRLADAQARIAELTASTNGALVEAQDATG